MISEVKLFSKNNRNYLKLFKPFEECQHFNKFDSFRFISKIYLPFFGLSMFKYQWYFV